jgi:hypothetical protein
VDAGPPPEPAAAPPDSAAPPPDDSGVAPDAPPEDAAPPEAPPEGAPDTGVPDSDAGEIGFDAPRAPGEREFIINGPCTLNVQMQGPVAINNINQLRQMPNAAGVYIVYSSGQPWYVGIATNAIRDRFLQRLKALRDLNIPEQLLSERTIQWVTLKDGASSCGLVRRKAGPTSPSTPVQGKNAALNVIEQFFIAQCKTNVANRGNSRGEPVRVVGSGPLTIVVQKSDGTSKSYPFAPKPGKGNLPGIVIDSRRG